MNSFIQFKKFFVQNKILITRFLPFVTAFFVVFSLLLFYPDASAKGVENGINICLDKIIPTLFPMLVVTTICFESGVIKTSSGLFRKIMYALFRLPGEAAPVILMSLIGGYPIGSVLSAEAYRKGILTREQASRTLLFCVNPGPAFTVSTVGLLMLNSKKTGILIYSATVLSSLIIGILLRFWAVDKIPIHKNKDKNVIADKFDITTSITTAVKNMLNICAWIIMFSSINSLLSSISGGGSFFEFYRLLSEVTDATSVVVEKYSLPIVSAVISFSGFCVHLQLIPFMNTLKLKYIYFLAVRIAASMLSLSVTFVIQKMFPSCCEVISYGIKPEKLGYTSSIPVCVCFMIMCGLFIIGDNYKIAINNKKQEFYN